MLQFTNHFKPKERVTTAKYIMVDNHEKLFYINVRSLWTECLQQPVKREILVWRMFTNLPSCYITISFINSQSLGEWNSAPVLLHKMPSSASQSNVFVVFFCVLMHQVVSLCFILFFFQNIPTSLKMGSYNKWNASKSASHKCARKWSVMRTNRLPTVILLWELKCPDRLKTPSFPPGPFKQGSRYVSGHQRSSSHMKRRRRIWFKKLPIQNTSTFKETQ